MSTDTKIKTLIFNKLTQEQYNNADRVPTEFYLTPDTSIDSSEKGAANGVASLDTNGKVPAEQIPTATTTTLGGVKPDGTTITVTENGTISATGGSGSGDTIGLSIGDVVYSYSSLSSENPGKLPLFTGETIASANTIYPEFYNWLLSHTELQCTSAEYEAALTTYGECAKYVIGGGSLRLPLIKNYIKAANTSEGIKNIEAGLPNITGDVLPNEESGNTWTLKTGMCAGAFSAITNSPSAASVTTTEQNKPAGLRFDASRSSAVYGKSSTVTPASTTLYPWVVAYTAAIPASTAQAAEFQQGLSGKADTNLGNVPSNYDYVVESQVNADGSWYRKYKSGWLEQGGGFGSNDATDTIVTLLKPYANTTYSIMVGQMIGLSGDATYWNFAVKNKTTSTVTIYNATNGAGNICQWEAKGMGAN